MFHHENLNLFSCIDIAIEPSVEKFGWGTPLDAYKHLAAAKLFFLSPGQSLISKSNETNSSAESVFETPVVPLKKHLAMKLGLNSPNITFAVSTMTATTGQTVM